MGTSIFQRLLLLSCVGMALFWSFASIEKMEELSASGHSSMQLDEPATNTPLPPTATNTPLPPTATNTPLPPTATNTPLPPTATNTPLPPTATNTPLPPTPTHTATPAPSNQPPSISVIADRSINEDQSTGIITFTVADLETPANQLTVTAASSNTTLLPPAGLKLGGSGSSRNIMLIPAANRHGNATITITVGDGSKNAQRSFKLTVRPINDPPQIDLNGSGSGVDFSMLYVSKEEPIHIADSDARVSDVDRNELSSATITITNLLDGADEVLTADTEGTGISASYNAGVLILSGSASAANYQQVIRTITYHNNAFLPITADRLIQFIVNDGTVDSNIAISTINIINPHLSIEISPSSQTIAQGGSAIFTIEVQNIGSVRLEQVAVLDPAAPDCARELGTLDINDTRIYSCNQREINAEFTNLATVRGQDSSGHVAFDEDFARVEVANPNIEIIQSPSSQTLLKGEDAIFDVFVINTSSAVDLVDVKVADPLVPDCSRTGTHPFHNLAAGEEVVYQCRLTNVRAAFTNVITITGTSLITQQIVQDSNVAKIELLDLSTALQANPTSLMSPEGMVSLTLTIHNLGSVDVTLTSLASEKLGSLLDSGNTQLISNNCSSSSLPTLAPAQQFSCTFSGIIAGTPPREEIVVTVEAHDVDNNFVRGRATTQITFVNPQVHKVYFPLSANTYAQSDEDNDFPCQAIPISIGHVHRFRPEDQDDWYYFDILQEGPVTVRLRDFIPEDGQLAVWTGPSCSNLDTLEGHNANFLPEKEVSFIAHPDRYYVWISNLDNKAYNTNYTLFVDAP